MSFTNFIDDGNVTILQGINGIRLFEESWVTEKAQKCKEKSNQKPDMSKKEKEFLDIVKDEIRRL